MKLNLKRTVDGFEIQTAWYFSCISTQITLNEHIQPIFSVVNLKWTEKVS